MTIAKQNATDALYPPALVAVLQQLSSMTGSDYERHAIAAIKREMTTIRAFADNRATSPEPNLPHAQETAS